jgi:RNA polymerase sigma factor (sigma-70 family)
MPKTRKVRPDESVRSVEERNALVSANLGIVYNVVFGSRTWTGLCHSPLCRRLGTDDDLIGHGNVALVRAAECWRAADRAKFSSFAHRWIRRYILRQARDAGLIRVPARISAAIQQGRPVSPDRHAAALAAWSPVPVADAPEPAWDRDQPSDAKEALLEALADATASLSPAEQQLLAERFGLGGSPIRLFRELADEEGLWPNAIVYRLNKVLGKLRARLEAALDGEPAAKAA